MTVRLRATRLSQPQGPVGIDWANPLTRGLIFASNSPLIEAVTKSTIQTNNGVVTPTPAGLGTKYTKTSNQKTRWGDLSSAVQYPLTLFALVKAPQSDTSGVAVSIGNGTGSAMLLLRSVGTGAGVEAGLWTGSSYAAWRTTASYTQGKVHALVVRFISAGVYDAFIDGVGGVTNINTGSLGMISGATRVITGHSTHDSGTSDGFDGTVIASAAFARSLSLQEIKDLSANPWQLFAPTQRRIWVPVASGGGTSQTIAFTLDDLTSSVSQTLSHSQSAAFTLDDVLSTVNQTVTHSQSLSATLDDVTASISQELAGAKSQSIAFTLDGITASVSQTASHAQSLAITLDDVTVAISQSAAPSSKDQSLAITLDDIFVDIKQAGPRRRQAGGKRNYIIKGKKYHLNDYELAVMIQGMLEEVERSDVEIDDGEAVKKVSRRVWKQLKESNAQLDFTLKELQSKVAIQDIDDEDDIALLML